MVVVRFGKRLIINVTDYDPETDDIPDAVGGDESVTSGPVGDDDPDRIAIPDGWEALSWPALRSLASKVSPTPVQGRVDAVAAIQNYLKG